MDMFNNVTSTMTNWWGKGGKKPDENEKKEEEKQSEPVVTSETGEAEEVKEGDEPRADSPAGEKSPPTSEADSVSIASQPEEIPEDDGKEKVSGSSSGFGGIAVDIEEVSSKAFQSAKNLGNFLFSVGKKAGKTVTDTAKHLKHTVEENSILGEFNKEQEAFLQEKNQQQVEAAVPPWIGYSEEEEMKQQILSLSLDRRNFLRSPPSGVSFQFNYDSMYPVAQATLTEDVNLEKMRFELVPKCISEENFWKNYFYRVSLIKQSAQLSSLAQETGSTGDSSAKSSRKSSVDEGKDNVCKVDSNSAANESQELGKQNNAGIKNDNSKKVNVDKNEEEWEKELQQELQEYEVVNDGDQPHLDDAEWEQEIQKILAAEESQK